MGQDYYTITILLLLLLLLLCRWGGGGIITGREAFYLPIKIRLLWAYCFSLKNGVMKNRGSRDFDDTAFGFVDVPVPLKH